MHADESHVAGGGDAIAVHISRVMQPWARAGCLAAGQLPALLAISRIPLKGIVGVDGTKLRRLEGRVVLVVPL